MKQMNRHNVIDSLMEIFSLLKQAQTLTNQELEEDFTIPKLSVIQLSVARLILELRRIKDVDPDDIDDLADPLDDEFGEIEKEEDEGEMEYDANIGNYIDDFEYQKDSQQDYDENGDPTDEPWTQI